MTETIDYQDIRCWIVMPDGYRLYVEDYIYTYHRFTVYYNGRSMEINNDHKRQYDYLMKLFGNKLKNNRQLMFDLSFE